MRRLRLLLFPLILLMGGCAAAAKRPPSPATNLAVEDLLATLAPANERYYVMVFGSESSPIVVPSRTHSWATVVKVASPPDGSPRVEPHTISWMPATLEIHPWRFKVEPGVNLDLHTTIEEMLRNKEKIYMWGPYEVWHGAYHRFVTQKGFLESGAIGYQCIDTVGEAAKKGNGSDCIHAVTDMDPQFDRSRYPLRYFGESASENVVEQLQTRPVLIQPTKTHDWLIPVLGLDRYPICQKTYTGESMEFSPEALRRVAGSGSACVPNR